MCFRPDSVGGVNTCPECGQLNPTIATNCIKCHAPLPNSEGDGEETTTPPIDHPETPTPKSPGAPNAPTPPSTPAQ